MATLLESIPVEGRTSLFRHIMNPTTPWEIVNGYTLFDGNRIKYLGKSDTAGHEADDVFIVLPPVSSTILEKLRFIGGVDSSTDDVLNVEVKTPNTEWEKYG